MSIVYQETDTQSGIKSKVYQDEMRTVIVKEYDAEPFVKTASEIRAETEGERWGDMRHVGFIPMAELGTMMRQDGTIDQKRCIEFLKKNPAFVTFSKVLK